MEVPDPRPIFNLDKIIGHPTTPVVIVEGEKCADALTGRLAEESYLVTTCMGGSNSVGKADLEPLRGRGKVISWPDADEAGRTYVGSLAAWFTGRSLGTELREVITPEGKANGWDAADAIEEGMNIEGMLCGSRAPWPDGEPDFADDSREEEDPQHEKADADSQTKSRFKFISDTDLERMPAPAWLVRDVIVCQTVNQIVGAPGSMKSFLALDLAAHVRLGPLPAIAHIHDAHPKTGWGRCGRYIRWCIGASETIP